MAEPALSKEQRPAVGQSSDPTTATQQITRTQTRRKAARAALAVRPTRSESGQDRGVGMVMRHLTVFCDGCDRLPAAGPPEKMGPPRDPGGSQRGDHPPTRATWRPVTPTSRISVIRRFVPERLMPAAREREVQSGRVGPTGDHFAHRHGGGAVRVAGCIQAVRCCGREDLLDGWPARQTGR